MGAPTIGGDTTGAVTEDSGLIVQGDLDDVGFLSGTNDDTFSISAGATYGTATIDPSTGTWSYDLDDTNPVVDGLGDGDPLTDTFTVLMVDSGGGSDTQEITITITGVVCFAAGTLIETERGLRPVENIRAGERLRTADNGWQTLRWVGAQEVSAAQIAAHDRLRPVRIEAGALGNGLPARDLVVSRQHRVLVSGTAALRAFDASEVLIPAIKLVGLPGISMDEPAGDISYHHLLLDAHQVLFAEGAPCESLLAGPQALAAMPEEDRMAIEALFPLTKQQTHRPQTARPLPQNGAQIRRYLRILDRGDEVLLAGSNLRGAA